MSGTQVHTDETVWELPPLILHPFNEHIPPSTLLENSKAALMLSGLIPNDGTEEDELHRRVMAGRYAEIRMLYFLGKDVLRWIDQCVESANRNPALEATGIKRQSFAQLLTTWPPDAVKEKLAKWGVADYASIFSRAIGINAMFRQPPEFGMLADDFLREYHSFADALYRCYMESEPHRVLTPLRFPFELYASGEYSRLLESKWESSASE